MPNLSSPLATGGNAGMPLVRADALAQCVGIPQVHADIVALNAAVAGEVGNIAAGGGIYTDGQPLGFAAEVALGVWRVWNATAQHARLARLPSGTTLLLTSATGRVWGTSGAPSASVGSNGDFAFDAAGNAYYAKSAGAWTSQGSILAVSGAPAADTIKPVLTGAVVVSNLTATSATISWSAGTDNSGTIAEYRYSINGGGQFTSAGVALSKDLTALTQSTTYSLQVIALDATGNISTPITGTLTTPAAAVADTVKPLLSGAVTFTGVGNTGATLVMPTATDDSGTVSGFRYALNGGAYIDVGNVASVPLTGLSAGTAYSVNVVAYDPSGNTSLPMAGNFLTTGAVAGNAITQAWAATPSGAWKLLTAPAWGGLNGNACTASISNGSGAAGNVLTVTAVAQNSIGIGQYVKSAGVAPNTKILTQVSGTPKGVGVYTVDTPQLLASGAVDISALLPRTLANFNGGTGLFPNDAQVAANVGYGGGIGNMSLSGSNPPYGSGYFSMCMNPVTGKVLGRHGGHGDGGDGSLVELDLFNDASATWKVAVKGCRLNSASVPAPSWYSPKGDPTTLVVTAVTVGGKAGDITITVSSNVGPGDTTVAQSLTASGASVGGGCFVWDSAGAVLPGTVVKAVNGLVWTLSNPLVADLPTTATVRFTAGAHFPATNADGVQMPPPMHCYDVDAWLPGTDSILLGGLFVFGENFGNHSIGGGWSYSPTKSTNGGMTGPLQAAAGAQLGRLGDGGYNFGGLTVSDPVTGAVYIVASNANASLIVARLDNPLTTPVATVLRVSQGIFGPQIYMGAVASFPDPRAAGKVAILSDLFRQVGGKYLIVGDITSATAPMQSSTWDAAPPAIIIGAGQGGPARAYTWNSDLGVMACFDGMNIYEFPITWNGTAYVTGAWTTVTSAAAGDLPEARYQSMVDAGLKPRLHFVPGQGYIVLLAAQARIYKR